MFSVLMSIYKNDNPAWLKESIDSIFNQRLQPGEVLIVKDGPLTRELEDILAQYNNPAIAYLAFPQNRGQEISLKEGLIQCKYELVARMDSDDVCHPDRFYLQYQAFQNDPSLDVVGGSIIEFDHTIQDATTVRQLPIDGEALSQWAKRRSPANHAAVMYRKSSVIAAGNYQDFLWNEDYHLWARMLLAGCKFKNLPDILLYVRGGKSMYQRRGGIKYALQDYKLQKRFYEIGFVSLRDMLINMVIRIPIRLLPNSMRRFIYEKFLRN